MSKILKFLSRSDPSLCPSVTQQMHVKNLKLPLGNLSHRALKIKSPDKNQTFSLKIKAVLFKL